MYYHPFYYPVGPLLPISPSFSINIPYIRAYPPVDTKIFEGSVKSFHFLMEQGNILLNRLGDANLSHRIMVAAQQGNNKEVDRLIKSLGLKVPVETQFTPSGVHFTLSTQTSQNQPISCCTLTVALKWGR